MHFYTWYNFSPQKWITALCSSLVQMKLGVSMFMEKNSSCTTMVVPLKEATTEGRKPLPARLKDCGQ
jgi:uncharacterized protein YhjY with autotransporter beta-barrel domain